jgi:tricarballylate dehydrogenase
VTDSQAVMNFLPSVYPPYKADSIEELGRMAGLDGQKLARLVAEYNQAVRPGTFKPMVPDDCRTEGLTPPKSHWARRIDRPPYYAYPLRPGITFTFLGLRVDDQARVQMQDGRPAANIWASGEIMSGNILGQGYLAGFGMTMGTVFGRLAGEGAARHVRN